RGTRSKSEKDYEARARPRFSDWRLHLRARWNRAGLQDRPRNLSSARESSHRAGWQRAREHRYHRAALSGKQIAAYRSHRRPGSEQENSGHQRHSRRKRSRWHAYRHRSEARRRATAHSESPVQANADAGIVRHDFARHCRGPAARTRTGRTDQAFHRASRRSGAPPHAVRFAQGRRARAHFGRLQNRPRSSRRNHQAHPPQQVAEGSQRSVDGDGYPRRPPALRRHAPQLAAGFTDRQAQAILDLQLHRLTQMEREKILTELKEIQMRITELKEILASDKKLRAVIVAELKEILKDYGDERRTQIVDRVEEIKLEDLIKDEEMAITVSHAGYVKRTPVDVYRHQSRGGKGRIGAKTREEDF